MAIDRLDYRLHISSKFWKDLRRDILLEQRFRCEQCGVVAPDLELHHTTYERFGFEERRDVRLLCKPCHRRADAERERETAGRRWAARVNGFMVKRHGENWNAYFGWVEANDLFVDFLAVAEDEWDE